ncbi:CPBP family intramembrane glutamic endopeptidase [Fodinibius sp. AD559]|uniref:CPBP family intramembrane glutamic endopeptidase n=1 Tax=Fodinibius sp. AD559 TaxID=3424179 RepID=UPI004046B2A1
MINNNNINQQPESDTSEHIPSRELLILSIISATAYLLLAFLIYRYVHEENIKTAFEHGYPVTIQLLIGFVSGGIAAGIIGLIISRPPVSDILHDFYIVDMVSKLQLTRFDRIQLSAFAGVGEELLFRGAIQPLLGIWFTSVIFIGIHGYFKFKSVGHLLFGAMMFGLSMMLGYLFESAGLIAAMSAHAVYDIIMLQMVQSDNSKESNHIGLSDDK